MQDSPPYRPAKRVPMTLREKNDRFYLYAILAFIVLFIVFWTIIGGYEVYNFRPKTTPKQNVGIKERKLCCYFGQHFHQCYTGKEGCDIGAAVAFMNPKHSEGAGSGVPLREYPHTLNGPEYIECSTTNECPGSMEAGFFLRGFRYDCPECSGE